MLNKRTTLLGLAVLLVVVACGDRATGQTWEFNVNVSAKANIFSSGASSSFGGGILPVQINLPANLAGGWIEFPNVTGQIKGASAAPWTNADGYTDIGSVWLNAFSGISGVSSPQPFYLSGVFLADTPPRPEAPPVIDFHEIGLAWVSLTPMLQQVFFVGDGLSGTGSGVVQRFFVPDGATRLFLGLPDGFINIPSGADPCCYADNGGSLSVVVRIVDPFKTPPGNQNPPQPPPYGTPPPADPDKTKAIVITHGWNTDQDTFISFWLPLGDAIHDILGPDWQVFVYNWTSDSQTPWFLGPLGSEVALAKAIPHGTYLGNLLAKRETPFEHVHFIAHSAGSALITSASERLKNPVHGSPDTTIHTTYLDAFAGMFLIGPLVGMNAYGAWSDWSDHYFSRENLVCFPPFRTGPYTQLKLNKSFNVDVSLADPGYSFLCRSTHQWPYCLYRYSVDSSSVAACEPVAGSMDGFGFPLSYAAWDGDAADWLAHVTAKYQKGDLEELPGPEGGGDPDADLVWRVRHDPPLDLDAVPSFVSDEEAVHIADGILTLATQPEGAKKSAPAWVNFQITTSLPINFVMFDLEFTSGVPGAESAGLMTLFVNGMERGLVDEVYTLPGSQSYAMPTPGDLEPGTHVVSFRLDQFGESPSSVAVLNVATGKGAFVNIADLNADGSVGVADLLILLANWGDCTDCTPGNCPADLTGSCSVGVADLLILLANWG